MAYRKKAGMILKYKPDIVVVPECGHPDKLKFDSRTKLPTDIVWFGQNPNKGLGVFSYSDFRFQLHKDHNPNFKTILPISVTGGESDFKLFAVWANNPGDKDGVYVTQVWKALHYYDHLISENNTILAGDFNSNTVWDKPRREGNHSTVVEKLAAKKIISTYHQFRNQKQGNEKNPTYYLYRHSDKPYHLDYCFASFDFAKRLTKVEIGSHRKWSAFSDHVPLMVTFDL